MESKYQAQAARRIKFLGRPGSEQELDLARIEWDRRSAEATNDDIEGSGVLDF